MGLRMNRLVSWAMVITLLMNVFALVFFVQPAGATGTIYIRADGLVDPPTVPISSADNVTYTLDGNIHDSIVVERSNIVLDGNGYTLQGPSAPSDGIRIGDLLNVTIKNFVIADFPFDGISMEGSCHTIINNTIINNGGSYVWNYYRYGGVNLMSNNSVLKGNNITRNKNFGVASCLPGGGMLVEVYNNVIEDNFIGENWPSEGSASGVVMCGSSNHIVGNNVSNNNAQGISLRGYSDVVFSSFNVIDSNIVSHNGLQGISLGYSTDNIVRANNVTDNYSAGIELGSSNNNTLNENFMRNNGFASHPFYGNGISLDYSCNNIITGNNILDHQIGVHLWFGSSNNTIHHNCFINNSEQTYLQESLSNRWDDGYPSGGNYWNDYNGTDLYSGPYQNETGNDGIGDSQYIIDSNNQDKYPLMQPYWNPADVNHDSRIDVKDVYAVSRAFGSSPSYPKWNPICDINNDKKVDLKDYYIVCRHYGEVDP